MEFSMIVTKISLTADQQFESEIEINLFFFGSSTELNQAVLEHADKVIANNWILNNNDSPVNCSGDKYITNLVNAFKRSPEAKLPCGIGE
jgi:hypothetical protein